MNDNEAARKLQKLGKRLRLGFRDHYARSGKVPKFLDDAVDEQLANETGKSVEELKRLSKKTSPTAPVVDKSKK